jgi:hypothetical protein
MTQVGDGEDGHVLLVSFHDMPDMFLSQLSVFPKIRRGER